MRAGDPIPDIAINIPWEVEQAEHSGKYHIWYHRFIYDIIADIIYDIQVQGRKTYAGMTNSAWMCILSSQPAWMIFQVSQLSCVQTMGSRRGQRGLSIRIANPIRLSAGHLQNLQRGSARTMGRSFRLPPSTTWSVLQGS